MKDNRVKCQGCGKMIKWTPLYGDWCAVCKPRDLPPPRKA